MPTGQYSTGYGSIAGENTTAPTEQAASQISRVAVRIPPFCQEDPEMWFCMAERSFEASGIKTDTTKFGYILGALEPRYAAEVREIILNPPEEGAYQLLRSELTRRLSSTQEQKTRRLLEHEEIGDRKPSQFLRHLRTLAGTAMSDEILRTLWPPTKHHASGPGHTEGRRLKQSRRPSRRHGRFIIESHHCGNYHGEHV
jgi:hypothetical protein